MKVLPLSILISAADGSLYTGHRGSTTLFVLNSWDFGLVPSISSIYKGFDCLVLGFIPGIGSTYVDKLKPASFCFFGMRILGSAPSISLFWKDDYR